VASAHGGGGPAAGLKVTSRLALALAADAARRAGADEALLVCGAGLLVEGARSNVFVADRGGRLATPALAAGAVAGVARGVVLERVAGVAERAVAASELRAASEIVCVNAVRGACPVLRLDGEPVGSAAPGPWAARLAAALARD
jgi:D-alanine transaminase